MKNTNINQAWAKLALLLGAVLLVRLTLSQVPPIARGVTGHLLERGLSSLMHKSA